MRQERQLWSPCCCSTSPGRRWRVCFMWQWSWRRRRRTWNSLSSEAGPWEWVGFFLGLYFIRLFCCKVLEDLVHGSKLGYGQLLFILGPIQELHSSHCQAFSWQFVVMGARAYKEGRELDTVVWQMPKHDAYPHSMCSATWTCCE